MFFFIYILSYSNHAFILEEQSHPWFLYKFFAKGKWKGYKYIFVIHGIHVMKCGNLATTQIRFLDHALSVLIIEYICIFHHELFYAISVRGQCICQCQLITGTWCVNVPHAFAAPIYQCISFPMSTSVLVWYLFCRKSEYKEHVIWEIYSI